MPEISLSCACGNCTQAFLEIDPKGGVSGEALRAHYKTRTMRIHCVACGCYFETVDDAVDVSAGGSIMLQSMAKPQVDSINIDTGIRSGGQAVFIAGHALDVGDLIVKFGGTAALAVDQRTADSARVITPPATYSLKTVRQGHRLEITPTHSTFQLNEAVTTTAGSSGTVVRISGNTFWVIFDSLVETLEDMTGTNLVGNTTSAVASIDAVTLPEFQPGETVSGETTAAMSTFRSLRGMIVDAPTAAFAPNELIFGAVSGALARLSPNVPYNGAVDITVENEYGQRRDGGTLSGAFAYA